MLVLELYFFAMADAAVDSVTALSKLLETQDGVDRLVHLEAVKKTLGALSFTVDQALHVSAAISGCAGFDEILTATGDKANGGHKGSDGQDP